MEEQQNIYDAADVSEDMKESQDGMDDQEEEYTSWKPKISKESPKEKLERIGKKEKADGKTLTIKEIFHTRPKIFDAQGNKLPPKLTQNENAEFYPGKLGVKFVEDNIVEYYPGFKYFVNEGKVNDNAKINRDGESATTKLFQLACKKMGKPEDEVSDQDFYDFLVGKKVKIKTLTGKYLGKEWFRNDIVEFV